MQTFLASNYRTIHHTDTIDASAVASIVVPEVEHEEIPDRPAIDIMCVVDVSGSMGGECEQLLRASLKFLVSELAENDRLGIISFCSEVKSVLPLSKVTDKAATNRLIDANIGAFSATALAPALYQGLIELRHREEPNPVGALILLTDGYANVGDSDATVISEKIRRLMSGDRTVIDGAVSELEAEDEDVQVQIQGMMNAMPEANVDNGDEDVLQEIQQEIQQIPMQQQVQMPMQQVQTQHVQMPMQQMPPNMRANRAPGPIARLFGRGRPRDQTQRQLRPRPVQRRNDGGLRTGPLLEAMLRPAHSMSLYTIGLGRNHDTGLLSSLAESSGGLYNPIAVNRDIADVYGNILGGLVSTCASTVVITLSPSEGVVIDEKSVFAGATASKDNDGSVVCRLPTDISSGERKDIPLTFKVPALASPAPEWEAMKLTVSYFDVKDKTTVSTEPVGLMIGRTGETELSRDTLVDQTIIRRDIVTCMADARKLARTNESAAKETLQAMISRVEASSIDQAAKDEYIANIKEVLETLETSYEVMDQYVSAATIVHTQQRAAPGVKSTMYSNKGRAMGMKKSKAFFA